MNTYPIVYREHNAAVFTLKNLGGDPEAICQKIDASYVNEDDWRTGRSGTKNTPTRSPYRLSERGARPC